MRRDAASPSSRTTRPPHTGQSFGISNRFSWPVRTEVTTPTTFGITSPPRSRITRSPIRMSFRRISSSLWSVALLTVTPPRGTGSRCDGRERSRPPHLDFDGHELRRRLLRRELVRDRPPRALSRRAQALLEGNVVHLDHHPVDLVGKSIPPLFPGIADLDDFLDPAADTDVRVHLEAERSEEFQTLVVSRERGRPRPGR